MPHDLTTIGFLIYFSSFVCSQLEKKAGLIPAYGTEIQICLMFSPQVRGTKSSTTDEVDRTVILIFFGGFSKVLRFFICNFFNVVALTPRRERRPDIFVSPRPIGDCWPRRRPGAVVRSPRLGRPPPPKQIPRCARHCRIFSPPEALGLSSSCGFSRTDIVSHGGNGLQCGAKHTICCELHRSL